MAKGPAATTGRRPRRSSRVSRSTWASSASNAARVYTRTAPAVGRGRPRASLLLPRPAWPIRAVAPLRGRRRIGDQGGLGPHLPVLTRVGLPGASNLVPPDRPVRPFPNSNGATSHGGADGTRRHGPTTQPPCVPHKHRIPALATRSCRPPTRRQLDAHPPRGSRAGIGLAAALPAGPLHPAGPADLLAGRQVAARPLQRQGRSVPPYRPVLPSPLGRPAGALDPSRPGPLRRPPSPPGAGRQAAPPAAKQVRPLEP
jgi:hypothetical protein